MITEEQKAAVEAQIVAGKKIEAIKLYRDAAGVGLKEAKEAVESMTDALPPDQKAKALESAKGCASLIVLGLPLAGLASWWGWTCLT